jgi:phage tail-like protein
MDLDAFASGPGTTSGRIAPTGVLPPDGTEVFCLGSDVPGFRALCRGGDGASVSQTGTVPAGKNYLTLFGRTRAPLEPPASGQWVASAKIDGVTVSSRVLTHGAVSWDWLLDFSTSSSARTLTFGLELVDGSGALQEVEIPAFWIDALIFNDSTAPLIGNCAPTNGQGTTAGDGAPPATGIEFDVCGFGRTLSWVTVLVNSNLAVLQGTAQPGFTYSITPVQTDTGGRVETWHVSIQPATPLPAEATTTVEAFARFTDSTLIDFPWSFLVSGAPTIASVLAISPKQLRVTWSKAVLASNPAASDDALNPNLYSLAGSSEDPAAPFVPGSSALLHVVSVELVNATTVDVFLDVEMTPATPPGNCSYTLTASGVADAIGNGKTATATVSYVLPSPPGRRFDLMRWLPLLNRNEDATRDLLRFVRCIQEPANLLLADVDGWTSILDPLTAPEPMLDAMLADLGNPFPFVLSETQKRQLILLLPTIYSLRGLARGILATVNFFILGTFDLTGPFSIQAFTFNTMHLGISVLGNPGGNWILGPSTSWPRYAFSIEVQTHIVHETTVPVIPLSQDQVDEITFIANWMKVAHEHYVDHLSQYL